jgi:hypothetical protein
MTRTAGVRATGARSPLNFRRGTIMAQMAQWRENAALQRMLRMLADKHPDVLREVHADLLVPGKRETDIDRRTRTDARGIIHNALTAAPAPAVQA